MPRSGRSKRKKHFRLVTKYLRPGEKPHKIGFNLHHRKKHCQGGLLSTKNCVLVDIASHDAFNALTFVAGRLCNIIEKFVVARHIAHALNRISRIYNYAMSVDIEAVFEKSGAHNREREVDYDELVSFTSALKHLKKRNIEKEHLHYAVAKIKIIARIIADSRQRLIRPDRLVEQFNKIWLPKSDPIYLKYSARRRLK